jgi:hypothetical protein
MANLEPMPTETTTSSSDFATVVAAIMRIEDELKKRPKETLIETSDETDQIDAAFILAVPEFEKIHAANKAMIQGKEGKSGYSYSYADLSDLLRAVRVPLGNHGLGIIQAFRSGDGGRAVTVETKIIHKSSQFYRTRATMTNSDATPQGIGKIITYGRRYQLLAMLGVAPEEDDDAASGSGKTMRRPSQAPAQQQTTRQPQGQPGTGQRAADPNAVIGDKMCHTIRELLRTLEFNEEATVLDLTNNAKKLVSELNFVEGSALLKTLQEKRSAK